MVCFSSFICILAIVMKCNKYYNYYKVLLLKHSGLHSSKVNGKSWKKTQFLSFHIISTFYIFFSIIGHCAQNGFFFSGNDDVSCGNIFCQEQGEVQLDWKFVAFIAKKPIHFVYLLHIRNDHIIHQLSNGK